MKRKEWRPIRHKTGRWLVAVPRKLTRDRIKREFHYFGTEEDAGEFIDSFKEDREEHGRQAVTAEERQWIGFARGQLGTLDLLPEVIAHWKATGSGAITPTPVSDAVQVFKDVQLKRVTDRTKSDIRQLKTEYLTIRGEVIELARTANEALRALRDELAASAKQKAKEVLLSVFEEKAAKLMQAYINFSIPVRELAYEDYHFVGSKPEKDLLTARKLRAALEHYKNPKAAHAAALKAFAEMKAVAASAEPVAVATAGNQLGTLL